jgi:hypothetical protein
MDRLSSLFCCRSLLVGCLLAIAAGCGPPERAVVKGKVSYGGEPLPAGTVMFWGADNASATAMIEKDGSYVINDAPLGDVKITVTTPKFPPGHLEMMKRMKSGPAVAESVDPNDASKKISIMGNIPDKIVDVPPKYTAVETSGLTYTVKSGEQTHDIPITP